VLTAAAASSAVTPDRRYNIFSCLGSDDLRHIELCQSVELVAAGPDRPGFGVLIDELGGVCLLGLLDREWLSPAVIYATYSKGLSVMTDWTIMLNVATPVMGSARVRVALLAFALCTKSAILHSRPWALGLNSTLLDGGLSLC
jgi:hypothetical protein